MLNIFINVVYLDDIVDKRRQKRFPLVYFWLKDHFYQQSPEKFDQTAWSYSDSKIPIDQNIELNEYFKKNPPDIIGLSLYLWNEELLLHNAKWIKQNYPKTLVVAAGPNADSRHEFMKNNQYIDLVVNGPGAEIFRRIVDAKLDGHPVTDVDGVAYFDNDKVVRNNPLSRREDPLIFNYVVNFRDEVKKLMDLYTQENDNVIFPTMFYQGCPYSCSFCEQGTSLWTKITKRPIEYMYNEIDLITEYKDVVYEFADANFGIVKDYEKILDYIIAKDERNNLQVQRPTMAKNNADYTFHLLDKMIKNDIFYSDNYGYLALQDTNVDVLKLNGRPPSKEFEKIEQFKLFTKEQPHKTNHVDIIIGMPGQSFKSLTQTLYDLLKNDLLSYYPPEFYYIFPNTTLTSENNKIYYKSRRLHVRTNVGYTIGLLDHPDSDDNISLRYITETATLSAREITSLSYLFTLFGHIYGFTGWLRTPLSYLQNFHGVSAKKFVDLFAYYFKPENHHLLPNCIQDDLKYLERWFSGKDKFLSRLDNKNTNFLTPKKISVYRFHANYDEFSDFIFKLLVECTNYNDPVLKDIKLWQGAKTIKFSDSEYSHELISYNYDDLSKLNQDTFYKSHFRFKFETTDINELYQKLINVDMIPYIPVWEVEPVGQDIQDELKKENLDCFKESRNLLIPRH